MSRTRARGASAHETGGWQTRVVEGFGALVEIASPATRSPISSRSPSASQALRGDFQKIGDDMRQVIDRERKTRREETAG